MVLGKHVYNSPISDRFGLGSNPGFWPIFQVFIRLSVAESSDIPWATITSTLDPFQGPLHRQDGTLQVPEGEALSDDGLWGMTYFVQGAIGTMPAE